MFSMFAIVQSRGLMPFLIAAFSAGSPNASKPIGQEDVVAVHPPEAGERVGRGLDVPVADVQVARRVRVHRQQVVLAAASRRAGPSRTGRARPSAPASAARSRSGRSARSGRGRPARPGRPGRSARSVALALVGHGHASETAHPPPGRGVTGRRSAADGGATGTRTPDLLHAMQALFQLSYSPTTERQYIAGEFGRSGSRRLRSARGARHDWQDCRRARRPGGGPAARPSRPRSRGVAPRATDPGCGSSFLPVSTVLLPTRQRTRVEEPTGHHPDGRYRDLLPAAQRRARGWVRRVRSGGTAARGWVRRVR